MAKYKEMYEWEKAAHCATEQELQRFKGMYAGEFEKNKRLRDANKLMPEKEWHEDDGNVIWWKLPIEEPPYVGTPLDSDFEEGYYTHFTRLTEPLDIDD